MMIDKYMSDTEDISQSRILVVDDEDFVLNLSVRILKNFGCKYITTASTGNSAIEKLIQAVEPFDIVICDLNMPEMDGIEFMRHAAENNFTGGVIFLSGEDDRILGSTHNLAKAHNLNILGAIPKPPTPDALKLLLKKFKPAQQKKISVSQTSITEKELCSGINGKELQLVYQPIINIKTGKLAGVETLARWNSQGGGILGPGAFIPLAEACGLINDMTFIIYKKAIHQASAWMAAGRNLKLSINISINTFAVENIYEFFINTAKNWGIDLSRVVFEVTESQEMHDPVRCLEVMMRLRMKKFGLSIDNFGTGHSTLTQLKHIPFNELKIDRSFVHAATNDSSARSILESSIELAKKLKLEIVAEGVETREDWDLVDKLGCDFVQGYYCAEPMPKDKLIIFLKNWSGPH